MFLLCWTFVGRFVRGGFCLGAYVRGSYVLSPESVQQMNAVEAVVDG